MLAIIPTIVAAVVVAIFLGLGVLLFAQTLVALLHRYRRDAPTVASPVPRIAILIPAHDEAAGILPTLASLQAQIGEGDRLIVIADNCTDDTAAVARAAGAIVVERTDPVHRGKGFALDFGLKSLNSDPPMVVLMFDADCIAGPTTVRTLAIRANDLRRPVQARYIIRAVDRKTTARLAEFAQRMRNWVRPLGMKAAGLPTQLNGSGMGFHWTLFERQSLASGHLTEDLILGLDFARQGIYPVFCPDATVDSDAITDTANLRGQRTRWEHGNLRTILTEWPDLAARSLMRLDYRLAAMAWDLAVPPLALYSMLLLAFFCIAIGLGLLSGQWWPATMLGFTLTMLLVTIVMAQQGFARDLLSLRDIFFAIPIYLLRKAPVYFRFIFNRQVEWVKTKRDAG